MCICKASTERTASWEREAHSQSDVYYLFISLYFCTTAGMSYVMRSSAELHEDEDIMRRDQWPAGAVGCHMGHDEWFLLVAYEGPVIYEGICQGPGLRSALLWGSDPFVLYLRKTPQSVINERNNQQENDIHHHWWYPEIIPRVCDVKCFTVH